MFVRWSSWNRREESSAVGGLEDSGRSIEVIEEGERREVIYTLPLNISKTLRGSSGSEVRVILVSECTR